MRKESRNTVDLGDKFENPTIKFFKTDSVYTKRFEKVWKWCDWAKENNIKEKLGTSHDLGVDIVGQEYGRTLCAIQCTNRYIVNLATTTLERSNRQEDVS